MTNDKNSLCCLKIIEFTYYANDNSSESYTSYLPINNNPSFNSTLNISFNVMFLILSLCCVFTLSYNWYFT